MNRSEQVTGSGATESVSRSQLLLWRLAAGKIPPSLSLGMFAVTFSLAMLAQGELFSHGELLVPFDLAFGVAVGFAARTPVRLWWAFSIVQVVIASIAQLFDGTSWTTAIAVALLLSGQTLATARLLQATFDWHNSRWESLGGLVGASVGCAIAGAGIAALGTAAIGQPALPVLMLWAVSTASGAVIGAPALLGARIPRSLPDPRRTAELMFCLAIAVVMAVSLTASIGERSSPVLASRYLVIPLFLWFALRFGLFVSASVISIFDLVVSAATSHGRGPFVEIAPDPTNAVMLLQGFVCIVAVTTYAVAMNEERRRAGNENLATTKGIVDSVLAYSDAMISVRDYNSGPNGTYSLANPRYARAMGRRVDEIVGRDSQELFGAQEAARIGDEDRSVLEAGQSRVFLSRVTRDDAHGGQSRVHLVTKFPVVEADGRRRSVGSIALDITDHRRQERLMQLTFEQSPVPMVRLAWGSDGAGEVLDANRAAGDLLGVDIEELIGRSLDAFTHPDEGSLKVVPLEGPDGAVRHREVRLRRHDGTDIWAGVTATVVGADPVPDGIEGPIDDPFALVVMEDITARKVAENTLTHQALHDALTGVPNRYALVDRLEAALNRLWRAKGCVAVLFCDLDGFKNLNDILGHRAGDQVLVSASERLRSIMRPQDTVARLGGDEFVLICEDLPDAEQARIIGERIREAMREPFTIEQREFGVTVSVGITTTSDPEASTEDLLRRADLAMYRAKDNGRNRVEFYVDELETAAVARVEVTETLRRAIDEGRIVVHYQPVFDLEKQRIVSVEALARIRLADGQIVPPSEFIAMAESSGLVTPLGEQVLDLALDDLARWQQTRPDLQVAVNVSPRQLARSSFAPAVFERLIRRGLRPESLCLEITEGVVMDATGPTLLTLRRLRSYGVRVAIDDFGTGYSSLTTLKYLPADILKIDRTFVEGLGEDPSDTAIVGAVIGVAHDLDRLVIAEGVENSLQEKTLRDMGCRHVQGFRYGRPMSVERVDELLSGTIRLPEQTRVLTQPEPAKPRRND